MNARFLILAGIAGLLLLAGMAAEKQATGRAGAAGIILAQDGEKSGLFKKAAVHAWVWQKIAGLLLINYGIFAVLAWQAWGHP